jgi:hypothetical protein
MGLVLYTFWRSQAAFRVRIGLRLKALEAEMVPPDKRTDALRLRPPRLSDRAAHLQRLRADRGIRACPSTSAARCTSSVIGMMARKLGPER